MKGSARKQGLTLLVPLGAAHAASFAGRLPTLAGAFRTSLAPVRSLHFARLGVIPAGEGTELVFETTFEGEARAHLAELWGAVAPFFGELSASFGLPLPLSSAEDFARFAGRYARRATALYIADAAEPLGPSVELTPELVRSRFLRELGVVLALTPWFELEERLRGGWSRAELPAHSPLDVSSSAGQVSFAAVFLRRPGRLRELAFGRVLETLQGLLEGGVSTLQRFGPGGLVALHTARWVALPGRRVLFSAVVDGPLTAFFDRLGETVSLPVSAACMHLEGFPATRGLLFGGASRHSDFLRWLSAHQVEPGLCYSAAPNGRVASSVA